LGDKTKAKVARELGIRVNQLRQWRLDFEEKQRNGVPREQLANAEQDVGKLRREITSLREENDLCDLDLPRSHPQTPDPPSMSRKGDCWDNAPMRAPTSRDHSTVHR
jgi:hypothetical protein